MVQDRGVLPMPLCLARGTNFNDDFRFGCMAALSLVMDTATPDPHSISALAPRGIGCTICRP